jgi:hypothetical protein
MLKSNLLRKAMAGKLSNVEDSIASKGVAIEVNRTTSQRQSRLDERPFKN